MALFSASSRASRSNCKHLAVLTECVPAGRGNCAAPPSPLRVFLKWAGGENKGDFMFCQSNIENCKAEEFDCACGTIACSLHGHVDEGDDENCPNLVPEDKECVTPDLTHCAPPFVDSVLPCHLKHRWGILLTVCKD